MCLLARRVHIFHGYLDPRPHVSPSIWLCMIYWYKQPTHYILAGTSTENIMRHKKFMDQVGFLHAYHIMRAQKRRYSCIVVWWVTRHTWMFWTHYASQTFSATAYPSTTSYPWLQVSHNIILLGRLRILHTRQCTDDPRKKRCQVRVVV